MEVCKTEVCNNNIYAKGVCRGCYIKDYNKRNKKKNEEYLKRYEEENKKHLKEYRKKYRESQKKLKPLYSTWMGMKTRCYNSNDKRYKDWGGRGIKVCERWLNSYEAFESDMGLKPSPSHTLDRMNNEGNYEPRNCRWASAKEQANNRRINK